jgi:glycosyltransferase involved in cell wall biosynthesis
VVLFRANAIDSDSRAKKFALTLARLGYEVHVLSAEEIGSPTEDRWLGPVRVHPVIMTHSRRDVHKLVLGARRRRQFRVIDWTPVDEYVTQVHELKRQARQARQAADVLIAPEPEDGVRPTLWLPKWAAWRTRHAAVRGALVARRARWRAQWVVNVGYRLAWREWDRRRQTTALLATTRGVLPEVEDYAVSFGPVLDALEPDVIHAHHPLVLGTAVRAARRRRAQGQRCEVLYDARENFAGIPPAEQGNVRRHAVLVREEARYIRHAAAVVTVSEPIADTLAERYRLPTRPTVVLNVPVDARSKAADASGANASATATGVTATATVVVGDGATTGSTVRQAIGLAEDTPLLVYSGAVSAARGIDVLVEAMALLPGVHLALVTVPYPHPQVPALLDRPGVRAAADRIHPLPPVGQDELLHYLSGSDVAVHPMPGGSPNHDQALPNKLFEYLHAGLPLVVADAELMAAFVRRNALGEVFRSGDPADLARAVTAALDPARPRASRDELAARYSWQAQEGLIADLYRGFAPLPPGVGVPADRLPSRFDDLRVTATRPVVLDPPAPRSRREQPPESLESPSASALPREPSSTVNRGHS